MKLEKDKCVLFWKPENTNGIYSQWYISKFEFTEEIHIDLPRKILKLKIFDSDFDFKILYDIDYDNCEKFMMLSKAILFNDHKILSEIIKNNNPKKMKSLGRKVSNFDDKIWSKYSKDIVTIANYLKFSQNKELLENLLDTKNKKIIETSPYDKIWGIGLKETSKKVYDTETWNGKNYLGKCIMKVGQIIKKESDK
jgi:ribA/ribD-fused uncharacterized protein